MSALNRIIIEKYPQWAGFWFGLISVFTVWFSLLSMVKNIFNYSILRFDYSHPEWTNSPVVIFIWCNVHVGPSSDSHSQTILLFITIFLPYCDPSRFSVPYKFQVTPTELCLQVLSRSLLYPLTSRRWWGWWRPCSSFCFWPWPRVQQALIFLWKVRWYWSRSDFIRT